MTPSNDDHLKTTAPLAHRLAGMLLKGRTFETGSPVIERSYFNGLILNVTFGVTWDVIPGVSIIIIEDRNNDGHGKINRNGKVLSNIFVPHEEERVFYNERADWGGVDTLLENLIKLVGETP